jgi:periplasmic divalent cation tolerance protein
MVILCTFSGVESIYCWEGKVESSREILAIFKTTSQGFPAFEKALLELHPYKVPEIIALPAEQISKGYHDWLINNVVFPDQ